MLTVSLHGRPGTLTSGGEVKACRHVDDDVIDDIEHYRTTFERNGILYQQQGKDEAFLLPQSLSQKVMELCYFIPWAGHLGFQKSQQDSQEDAGRSHGQIGFPNQGRPTAGGSKSRGMTKQMEADILSSLMGEISKIIRREPKSALAEDFTAIRV